MQATKLHTDLLLDAIRACQFPSDAALCQSMARVYAEHYWGSDLDSHPRQALEACLWSTAELGGERVASLLEAAMEA